MLQIKGECSATDRHERSIRLPRPGLQEQEQLFHPTLNNKSPSIAVGQPSHTTQWSDASWTQVKQMPRKPLMFTGPAMQMFNPFAGNPNLLQTPQLWDRSTVPTYAPTFFYTWVVWHQLESFCQDKVHDPATSMHLLRISGTLYE